MTDLISYEVDQMETSIFNLPRVSLYETDFAKLKKSNNYYDLVSLISLLTSSNDIDYQLVGDFFLTFRSFISSTSLLKILLLRLRWCIEQASDFSHEKLQNIGKLTLIRTFVTIRHWILNYFTEDFISSRELRLIFINSINSITTNDIFIKRIISNLKKAWTECCNKSWDESVSSNDYYTFTIKIGPQDNQYKRLSSFALNQQYNPMVRNSAILSTFDPNKIHKLPIPNNNDYHNITKKEPKILLAPKNSNIRLSKSYKAQVSDTPLYTSLTSNFDTRSRNIIRNSTQFPITSTLSKILPPTPVKKMDVKVPLPPINSQNQDHEEPQRGLRPLIESWLNTFRKHNESKPKVDRYVEKFMQSVVSIPKIDSDKLNNLAMNNFDILSARTIDELEYLVRFHNEIMSKHGMKLGLNNATESFTFIRHSEIPKSPLKPISNIDNMNISETISTISKSVVSLRKMSNDDNRSFISYDSNKFQTPKKAIPENEEDALKKKKALKNLREFNFEVNNGNDNNDANDIDTVNNDENDDSQFERYPSSIISESTPNEISPSDVELVNSKEVNLVDTEKKVDSQEINSDDIIPNEESSIRTSVRVKSQIADDKLTSLESAKDEITNALPVGVDDIKQDVTKEIEEPEEPEEPEEKEQDKTTNEISPLPLAQRVRSIERPKPLSFLRPTERLSKEEVDDGIPPRSPDRLLKNTSTTGVSSTESVDGSVSESRNSVIEEHDELESIDNESFVSSYEDHPTLDKVGDSHSNSEAELISQLSNGPSTPPPNSDHDGLISSTPNISPIKSLNELNMYTGKETQVNQLAENGIDLNRITSFTRVSNVSIISKRSDHVEEIIKDQRISYLSKRSHKATFSRGSGNSIFSELSKNQRVLNVSVTQENESLDNTPIKVPILQYQPTENTDEVNTLNSRSLSLIDSINTENYNIPYPGVDSQVMAELAGITDDSVQDDPINAALLKLEGTYKKGSKAQEANDSIDSEELLRKVESLDIAATTPIKRSFQSIDQRRKTKLFSLTPVKQKDISQDLSSSRILMELLLTKKLENEALSVSNSEQHVPFILNFDSKSLAEQFTLIEKDCLLEIDWKELVDFKWDSNNLSPINSWLELLIQNNEIQGIDLCISRFNLTVNWIISEILLTKDVTLRTLTIQRFIHIAQNCKTLQNYSTLMQILLALGSDKVMKLKDTWRVVEPGDILIYKNLESIASPLKNFLNLRTEINKLKPSLGCVPFLGLYLSDLIFNKEKKSVVEGKINFGKFMHDSRIVRSLIQCIQWSLLYQVKPNDEILSKCLYIKALTEEEMNTCLEKIS